MDKFLDRELAEHRQLGTTDRDVSGSRVPLVCWCDLLLLQQRVGMHSCGHF